MVERAAAAGLPSPAEPAPRPASPLAALAAHYGLRAPARLEQLRALAARCRRLWAANPGVTGWVMREHRVGVNLACLLVEEHVARLTGAAEA